MDDARLRELLQPFLHTAALTDMQLRHISVYIDLLLRWNARVNLTSIRAPEEIVQRHFGESLFAARQLYSDPLVTNNDMAIDLGSGAGFPGLPLKIWAPGLHITLIESNQKKATFLREVIRALTLTGIDVFSGRAETFHGTADLVTLRAVERFQAVLPIAARLLAPKGRLALLIGEAQLAIVEKALPNFRWLTRSKIPLSTNRILVIGTFHGPTNQD